MWMHSLLIFPERGRAKIKDASLERLIKKNDIIIETKSVQNKETIRLNENVL